MCAKGYELRGEGENLVHILDIVPTDNLTSIDAILSLPKILFQDSNQLEKLISLRRSIESPSLAKFVDTLFADNEIALPFIQVPASSNYHHNHIGGLLVHSLEVAEIAANQSYANKDERDIAVVAALLHDIGKVKTLRANLSSTMLGKMVGHDSLTLELCAPALKELDKTWHDSSNTLRHVWNCATPGARYGHERNCVIANIVQFADKLSSDRFYENQAFKTSEKADGLAWDGKKYFWRLTPEPKTIERNRLCLLTNTH